MPWKNKIEIVEWTQRTKKSVFVRSKSCYFHSCDMINLFNFVYADIIQTHTLSPARVHTQGRQMYSWKNKKKYEIQCFSTIKHIKSKDIPYINVKLFEMNTYAFTAKKGDEFFLDILHESTIWDENKIPMINTKHSLVLL